jgi:hypothetical protein
MNKIPPIIRRKLAALRRRERLLTFVWGLACWLSLVAVLVLLAGFVDWLIDRQRDTPPAFHVGALGVQAVVAALAAVWFLLWPQVRRLPDAKLALWVEDKLPHFEHRLISAVQFNQRGANLEGMSLELVKVVTLEAEKETRKVGFARLVDHRRLKCSLGLLIPVALLAALPFALWTEMSWALLQRQALIPVEIPHSVYLVSVSQQVSPIGDDIEIYYRVTGAFDEDMLGTLSVTPTSQRSDRYPLSYITKDRRDAIFGAKVPSSSVDIVYSARLADGRTHLPSAMKRVPRPVIIENQAWIVLPEFCGKRPDGGRYEQPQGRGDVVGIAGSAVRVMLKTQKAITKARLEILGPEPGAQKISEDDAPLSEVIRREVPLTISDDGLSAEGSLDLNPAETGYRMLVEDEYGFANIPAPRRSMRIVPEDPPQVALLRDTFGIGADFDLEGLPVLLDGRIRIPYVCYGQYGLSKAFILYRVLKKHESGEEPVEDEPWIRLPLTEVRGNNDTGPFDPKTGVFAFTKFDQQVPFHAAPALNPNKDLGRTIGGGRFFLETKGLIDSKGKLLRLKSGDQIEYCVEVHAAFRKPETSIPVARSETRVSTVMQLEDFNAWLRQVGKEDERVKQLESKQKGVLERGP